MSDVIDTKAEIEILQREKNKCTKLALTLENKLSNHEFINNAPGHIVVVDEQKLKELKIQIAKITEQLEKY